MKIVDETRKAGQRRILFLSESAKDSHWANQMFRLLRETPVLRGELVRTTEDDFTCLRVEEMEP